MSEEEEAEEFEDVEDEPYEDFDDVDEIAGVDEIDENDIELDIDEDDALGGSGRRSRGDDMTELDPEQVAKANPKRQSVRKKRRRVIEGILDTAELNDAEGAARAWESLQKQAARANVRTYKVTDEYTENDVLEHPKFGEGYVVEILSATKISVLFEDGLRKLAYNRG